jgi:anti-sigma regulatory factor (Ser/Thr protein kinase)
VQTAVTQPTLTLTLPALPESARQARRALVERGLDPDLDHTVSLLTTELLANAIKHAGGAEVRFAATLAPGYARVEVLDSGPGFEPDAASGKGFGLRLVDKLSSRWGVERGRGTLVWFEVDRRRRRFSR